MEARRAELLEYVAAHAAATAAEFGLTPEQADQVGAAIADGLADDFGGQVIPFPKDYAFRLSQRDREILQARRDGATLVELMRRYKMTDSGLRRLLRRAEARDPHLNQHQLFGEGRP